EPQQTAAQNILGSVAAERTVHEAYSERVIHQKQPIRRVFRHGAQHCLGLAQRLFSQLAGGDVRSRAKHTRDGAGLGITHRHHADIQPLALARNGVDTGLACLGLAAQNARLPRRNDGPPLLIYHGVPAALLLLQRAPEDGLHAVTRPDGFGFSFGVVAILEYVARCHRGDGPITELALPQLLLGFDAVSDFHQEADHARGAAVWFALRHPATVEHPAPAAVFISEPVLRLVKLPAAFDHIVDGRLDTRPVLRVNARIPEAPGAITGFRVYPENPVVRLGVSDFAGGQVPIPHSTAGTLERCLQAPLAADVLELRLLALLDVHANTDHPQRNTIGIALNYPAALKQPAPPAFPVT